MARRRTTKAAGRVLRRLAAAKPDDTEPRYRYTALYWCEGSEAAAGTFDTEEEARTAWLMKAAELAEGRMISKDKQTATFAEFCKVYRLGRKYRNYKTASDQASAIRTHLIPQFGKWTMRDLEDATQDIDMWLEELKETHSDYTRKTLRGHLSGVLTVAVNWGYMRRNPVVGTQAIENPMSKAYALDRNEFDALHAAMPTDVAKLLIWVALMTGLRFGELAELRVEDVHNCDEDLPEEEWGAEEMFYFRVSRTVQDLTNTGQGRFHVKIGTKNNEIRNVDIDPVTTDLIDNHIKKWKLQRNDLLFSRAMFEQEMAEIDASSEKIEIPSDLGNTEPNERGLTYRHGTTTAYGDGKCRCYWCKYAVAEYRRQRRARGLDLKKRIPEKYREKANLTGHLPRDYFRQQFMLRAIEEAGIRHIRFHDLRHTHATWLAKDGISLFDLMQRMGHKTMSTTQKYIALNTRPHRRGGLRMAAIMTQKARRSLRRSDF